MLCNVALPTQTELVPHCGDIPPVGQVLQRDGKLLILSILEVRHLLAFMRV